MKNLRLILLPVMICMAALATSAFAQEDHGQEKTEKAGSASKGASSIAYGGANDAQQLTKAEAEKKYPPPRGGYPTGELTASAGMVKSPYPPHPTYNCSGMPKGAYVLDTHAKHVFLVP